MALWKLGNTAISMKYDSWDENFILKCSKPVTSFLNSSLSCNALPSAAYTNQYTLMVGLFSITLL